jgi:hypothetical protein
MIDPSEILTIINLGITVVTLVGGVAIKFNDINYLKKGQDRLDEKQEKLDIKIDRLPCMIPRCPTENWDGQERRKNKR